MISKIPEPLWQSNDAEFDVPQERPGRQASCLRPLMNVLVAVAGGMLVSLCLKWDSSLAVVCALIAVAAALPFFAGRLLKERLRTCSRNPSCRQAELGFPIDEVELADDLPAGLLIVSSDLRICYANRTYFEAAFQNPAEVLGWRLEDVVPAEGLEEQAKALLHRPHSATSCCFTTFPGLVPTERRPVSITMTRIPPVDGENRILVVVEDLLQNFPERQAPLVEGYIC